MTKRLSTSQGHGPDFGHVSKRGYITVEAAIFLPLFIVGVISVGFLMKTLGTHEDIMTAMIDESRVVALESYVDKTPGGAYLLYGRRVAGTRAAESHAAQGFRINYINYRFSANGISDLISVNYKYSISAKMPFSFKNSYDAEDGVIFRAFTGKNNAGEVKPFSEMEALKDSHLVWVFPKAGEKYHSAGCRFISNYPSRVLLSDRIKSRYAPCSHCRPDENAYGHVVYCFTSSGEVYHSGECDLVDKYVVEMEKEEAEMKGYTPCSVCGGGN